ARHESGVGQTTTSLHARIRHRRSGGDDPALLRLRVEGPLRGGTPNAEPRGRGVVRHAWRGPFLIARPRGHCGRALNGSIPLASYSRMPPSRRRALTLSRFLQRDLSAPHGTVRLTP